MNQNLMNINKTCLDLAKLALSSTPIKPEELESLTETVGVFELYLSLQDVLTDQEASYVSNNGTTCPSCEEFGVVMKEIDGSLSCSSCGSTWEDVYQLVKFTNLQEKI